MPCAGKSIEAKAAIAWDSKKPLEVTTVTVDPPGPGEVRVKIIATALCHTVRRRGGGEREGGEGSLPRREGGKQEDRGPLLLCVWV